MTFSRRAFLRGGAELGALAAMLAAPRPVQAAAAVLASSGGSDYKAVDYGGLEPAIREAVASYNHPQEALSGSDLRLHYDATVDAGAQQVTHKITVTNTGSKPYAGKVEATAILCGADEREREPGKWYAFCFDGKVLKYDAKDKPIGPGESVTLTAARGKRGGDPLTDTPILLPYAKVTTDHVTDEPIGVILKKR